MFRRTGVLVLGLFLAMLLAPFAVLVEFHVHRASIMKELCVQRDVVEGMRTCHGECQLSKRFKALEQEAEAGFPVERIQTRYEPQISHEVCSTLFVLAEIDRIFPTLTPKVLEGVHSGTDQVPRS